MRLIHAGYCAHFNRFGSNTLTTKSVVRKRKLAVRNILWHFRCIQAIRDRDTGHIASLGLLMKSDGASQKNVVTGLPALAIREIVESQYDLLLMGIDTYVV